MPIQAFPFWWTIGIFINFCHCTLCHKEAIFSQVNTLIWSSGPKGMWILNTNSKLPTRKRDPGLHRPLHCSQKGNAVHHQGRQSFVPLSSFGVERKQREGNSHALPVFCFPVFSLEDYRNNAWEDGSFCALKRNIKFFTMYFYIAHFSNSIF